MGRQLQHHNSSRNFLPLLCRLSIKDVKLPRWSDSSSSSSSTEDPSSPKVSCIGQVKKRNNKIISCPTTTFTTAPPKSSDNLKYTKLRKLFSGKNLLISATTIDTSTHTHSCKISRPKEVVMIRNSSTGMRLRRPALPPLLTSGGESNVNLLELDPPLPVVKKVQQPGGCEVNLWKRRCGGGGNGNGNGNGNGIIRLKSLQVQQIHVPNTHLHIHIQPTTV